MKNKYIYLLLIISMLLVISLIATASYAFFVASVEGNEVASDTVITTGHMEVTYDEGNVIGTTSNMIPGDYIEKYFRVTNTGTVDTVYDIYLNDVINTFTTKSDLAFTLISEDEKGQSVSQTICPDGNAKIVSGVQIGAGEYHNYTLKITFKNVDRNQDDNKGKGFSAKIDLVESENTTKYIADQIIDYEKVSSDLEYDGISTLGENGTEDNNLRYVGKTPDNYIYFNCSTTNPSEMNDSTCEKWRIIGVFNNIEDNNGKKESRVKIMRDSILGWYSWDTSDSSINKGYGINQWGESGSYEGADLMRELNTDYLGNITVGTDGKWYNGSNNKKAVNMPESLNLTTQSMIQEVKWNIGSNENNASSLWTVKNMYNYERSEIMGKICSSGTLCNDLVTRTTSWIGKVALMYPSDYGYATVGGTTTNKEICLNATLIRWYESEMYDCKNNSWIYNSTTWQWTLSPHATTSSDSNVFPVIGAGDVYGTTAAGVYAVRPVVFLKSSVSIVEGNGSFSNPYKLVM